MLGAQTLQISSTVWYEKCVLDNSVRWLGSIFEEYFQSFSTCDSKRSVTATDFITFTLERNAVNLPSACVSQNHISWSFTLAVLLMILDKLLSSYIRYIGNALIADGFKKASNIGQSPISVSLRLWYGAGFALLPLTLRPVLHP